MKTLNGTKTNLNLIANCDEALSQYKGGDRTPEVGGVLLDGAAQMGHCQQNVREIVEATAYGRERLWGEASCCATATHQRLKAGGWPSVGLAQAQPGDVAYFGPGGGQCGICHQDPGHVGILHHQVGGVWQVWQNTSYEGRGLCCIPLRESQRQRIVGIYRLFPLAEEAAFSGERRINWFGKWLGLDDVVFDKGEHFVNLRKAAAGMGAVVKVGEDGKVYVGPESWWGGT